jgi:hypothetical protein
VKVETNWYWLDHLTRIVQSDGRQVTDVSQAISSELETLSTPSDCFGWRCSTAFLDAVCFTFPTDGVTYAYQQGAGWSKWGSGLVAPLDVTCSHLTRDGGVTLVGNSTGNVLEMSLDSFDDNGTAFTAHTESGFLDRGTDSVKQCKALYLTLRHPGTGEPEAFIQYRDDFGAWSDPLVVRLGDTPSREATIVLRGLGAYRRRQWKFSWGASSRLALVRALEDFDGGLA